MLYDVPVWFSREAARTRSNTAGETCFRAGRGPLRAPFCAEEVVTVPDLEDDCPAGGADFAAFMAVRV